MSSIFAFGRYSGRLIDGFRILLFTGIIMVIYQPAYLFSLSFQLSFCATLGLIMFSTSFNHFFHSEDLSATLAAQVMVWPLISRTFGTFSIASFIINPLILWSVPISTMLGGVFILFGWVHPVVASTIAILLYPFLDIFVRAVNFFSSIKLASVSLSIAPLALIIYYTMTFAVWLKFVPKEG
jgi:competence protein ComEC